MEKLDKKKVLAVVLVVALIASLIGTVSLFYNSIDMFIHSMVDSSNYEEDQLPFAIITLFAFLAAALGTCAGISSFVLKKEKTKKVCVILALFAAVVLFILTLATFGYYLSTESKKLSREIPVEVYNSTGFAIYSAVMAVMLQQLVYSVVVVASLLAAYVIDRKNAKKQTEQPAEIPAQTDKEN